jgi:hypothetical protein
VKVKCQLEQTHQLTYTNYQSKSFMVPTHGEKAEYFNGCKS